MACLRAVDYARYGVAARVVSRSHGQWHRPHGCRRGRMIVAAGRASRGGHVTQSDCSSDGVRMRHEELDAAIYLPPSPSLWVVLVSWPCPRRCPGAAVDSADIEHRNGGNKGSNGRFLEACCHCFGVEVDGVLNRDPRSHMPSAAGPTSLGLGVTGWPQGPSSKRAAVCRGPSSSRQTHRERLMPNAPCAS